MIVFLTGATGYVGAAVLKKLLEEGHEVRCLVRRKTALTSANPKAAGKIVEVHGDLLEPSSYSESLRGADAVIHLVGIIREKPGRGVTFQRIHAEGTGRLVDAAKEAGVPRFVHMSALGAREGAVSGYHRSKWDAEQRLRASGIAHVIFRPSVIFGPGDEFVNMLKGIVKAPVTPVFGSGLYRMQPVSIRTVADIFAKALHTEKLNEAYEVGGPEQIPFTGMLKEIGRALGKQRLNLLHVPLFVTKPLVNALHRMPGFPITRDQLIMLLEENICRDGNRFTRDYDVSEIRFADGIRDYLTR
ncbi:NAD-dependent epimerase/dehydratase family protein [Paenibacillus chartarius]|uniref:NAD-dependent epimerase/dehydratase family protein n=1 Tax=Paenibacillus chartarius TaxID=747481 RepID=A0ABV6DFQ2_9BACL